MPVCKGCKADNHPAYDKRYGGYCLDCHNAGVPELDDQIRELTTQRDELLKAAKKYVEHFGDPLKCLRSAIAGCEKEPTT